MKNSDTTNSDAGNDTQDLQFLLSFCNILERLAGDNDDVQVATYELKVTVQEKLAELSEAST